MNVLIVVPVYDEAPLIARKLENLAALGHENRRIVVVDGGSTDGTIDIVRRLGVDLIETGHRNKTAQLNEATRTFADAEWILVTDADAHLEADALERLLEVAVADPEAGVVGARVRPAAAHPLETLHWRFTDWLREREHDRGSAAIVAAPCYLVQRRFLAELPENTIADDVHVACRAMLAGCRVGHAHTTVLELRSPRTLRALLRHKYRKADAYLREIVRFLPSARRMPSPMRTIFLWRAALLTLVPLAATPFVPLAIVLALLFRSRAIALAALLAGVSAAALVMFPFSRQDASFPKILQPDEVQ